jgi:hypothetical protein
MPQLQIMKTSFSHAGLQEVGSEIWRGARTAWNEPHTRSAVRPQLRSDLVRFYETRRRPHQDTFIGSFSWSHKGTGPTVKLLGLRESLQLPLGFTYEPTE